MIPKKRKRNNTAATLLLLGHYWYRLWMMDALKLWPQLISIVWFSGLGFFAIVLQSKGSAQYQQWNQVLQDLNKPRRLIIMGRCLRRWAWSIFGNMYCWNRGGFNLPNKVCFHHLNCWVTVANIFKISCGILLCRGH